ncbi:MAG: flagellar hook-length control protein FliK [Acidobacteriota bacterium]|nr:flagellar hook-length control protein FliK [Acidobacteriota bacterium]
MALAPDTSDDAAKSPDVTTTATSATATKTPASISAQAAASADLSASLLDAGAVRAAETTGTALPTSANAPTGDSKRAAASKAHSKTDEDASQPGATSAEVQTPAGFGTAVGAASAAAMAATTRLVLSPQSDVSQPNRGQEVPKPAEAPGRSLAATAAGATQNAKALEMPGTRVASATAVPSPTGTDSAATQQHSNSSAQNGHPDSSSANSDKNQAATATTKQSTAGAGPSAFSSQIGAAHDANGNPAVANPLAAGTNGGTNAGTPGMAAQGAEAGAANGGPFSPAAIAAQRDAGVASPGATTAVENRAIADAYGAQLLRSAGRSEMRIQFEADGLGPVELRAAAAGNTIGATISTDRAETHWLLANGVGTLHQALADHNVQVERIDILLNSPGNGGRPGGGGTNPGSGNGAQSNERSPSRPWPGTASSGLTNVAPEEATTSSATNFYRGGRLSVRV